MVVRRRVTTDEATALAPNIAITLPAGGCAAALGDSERSKTESRQAVESRADAAAVLMPTQPTPTHAITAQLKSR